MAKGPTKAETIKRLVRKHTRPQLVAMAKSKKVAVDETFKKERIAEVIYDAVKKETKEAQDAEKLKAAQEKAAEEAVANPVIAKTPQEVNLSPMKKPATYAILKANARVYDGILAEKVRGNVIRVVTGSGQRWEFPLDDS
jgi:predicted HAD superfamily Cof-like phosphohydrolase